VFEPFKAFFNAPCEICHEPVKEWNDYNDKLAVESISIGRTVCWNSELEPMRQMLKAI
jgi:hypothetical protein